MHKGLLGSMQSGCWLNNNNAMLMWTVGCYHMQCVHVHMYACHLCHVTMAHGRQNNYIKPCWILFISNKSVSLNNIDSPKQMLSIGAYIQ